jgi:hypothetical protein
MKVGQGPNWGCSGKEKEKVVQCSDGKHGLMMLSQCKELAIPPLSLYNLRFTMVITLN